MTPPKIAISKGRNLLAIQWNRETECDRFVCRAGDCVKMIKQTIGREESRVPAAQFRFLAFSGSTCFPHSSVHALNLKPFLESTISLPLPLPPSLSRTSSLSIPRMFLIINFHDYAPKTIRVSCRASLKRDT